jgi:hypothetical protein
MGPHDIFVMFNTAMDWPLSREEKKAQLLRLYSEDVQTADTLLHSGERTLEALRKELDEVRYAAGFPCNSEKLASTPKCTEDTEIQRLRAAVENAAAVLRAILPQQDDSDVIASAGATEAVRRKRKSLGSSAEQQSPLSALKKPSSRRNSRGFDLPRVSFTEEECSTKGFDAAIVPEVAEEQEPMFEPEPSEVDATSCSNLDAQVGPAASALNWLYDVVTQTSSEMHGDGSECQIYNADIGDCDGSARQRSSNPALLSCIAARPARSLDHTPGGMLHQDTSCARRDLRLLTDAAVFGRSSPDSEYRQLKESFSADCLPGAGMQKSASCRSRSEENRKESCRDESDLKVRPDTLTEHASVFSQRQGCRRARLRSGLHGYLL